MNVQEVLQKEHRLKRRYNRGKITKDELNKIASTVKEHFEAVDKSLKVLVRMCNKDVK